MLAILAQLGLASQVGNVRTGIGLGDGQADALVTIEDARQNAVDQRLLTKLDERRASNTETTDDVPDETTRGGAGKLIGQEHLVEEIPVVGVYGGDGVLGVLGRVVDTQQTSQVTALTHLLVDRGVDLLLLIPLGNVGLDVVGHPLADLGTESGVRLVEVGGVVLHGVSQNTPCETLEADLLRGTRPGRRRGSCRQRGPKAPTPQSWQ